MLKTGRGLVLLVFFLLPVLACAHTTSTIPAERAILPEGQTTHRLNYDGRERTFIVYVPESVNWIEPVAIVFVFHGGTGNAESAIRMSGFNDVADVNGFVVVYPNGTGRLSGDKLLTWNGGACCGYAQEADVDDVGFVRAIVADLQTLVEIDRKRIYATGMSNGGILSHRLACEAADLLAAVAPVAGTLNLSDCQPSQPVSVIEFHGTDDQHILYDGGSGPKALVSVDFNSVPNSIEFWISADECSAEAQVESFADIRHEAWTGCAGSTAVELYTVVGGGHSWPGGQGGLVGSAQPTMTISASQLIWDFFAVHPKQD